MAAILDKFPKLRVCAAHLGGVRQRKDALDVLADPTRYEAGQEVGLKFLNVKFYEEEAKA